MIYYTLQGFTVKPHYFAPMLKNTASRGDMDGKEYSNALVVGTHSQSTGLRF